MRTDKRVRMKEMGRTGEKGGAVRGRQVDTKGETQD